MRRRWLPDGVGARRERLDARAARRLPGPWTLPPRHPGAEREVVAVRRRERPGRLRDAPGDVGVGQRAARVVGGRHVDVGVRRRRSADPRDALAVTSNSGRRNSCTWKRVDVLAASGEASSVQRRACAEVHGRRQRQPTGRSRRSALSGRVPFAISLPCESRSVYSTDAAPRRAAARRRRCVPRPTERIQPLTCTSSPGRYIWRSSKTYQAKPGVAVARASSRLPAHQPDVLREDGDVVAAARDEQDPRAARRQRERARGRRRPSAPRDPPGHERRARRPPSGRPSAQRRWPRPTSRSPSANASRPICVACTQATTGGALARARRRLRGLDDQRRRGRARSAAPATGRCASRSARRRRPGP